MDNISKLIVTLAAAMLFLGWPTTSLGSPVLDPINDTFGTEPVQPDITSIDAVVSPLDLTFFVLFAGPISPSSAGSSDSIGGFIDLDTDQDPNTGDSPFINVFGPGPFMELGQDFYIDVFSEADHPGSVDVHRTLPDTIVGTAPITFTSTSFSINVALALLGGDDGFVNYDVVVGTLSEATDVAPNGSSPATSASVPEPATIWLLPAVLVVIWVIRTRIGIG